MHLRVSFFSPLTGKTVDRGAAVIFFFLSYSRTWAFTHEFSLYTIAYYDCIYYTLEKFRSAPIHKPFSFPSLVARFAGLSVSRCLSATSDACCLERLFFPCIFFSFLLIRAMRNACASSLLFLGTRLWLKLFNGEERIQRISNVHHKSLSRWLGSILESSHIVGTKENLSEFKGLADYYFYREVWNGEELKPCDESLLVQKLPLTGQHRNSTWRACKRKGRESEREGSFVV